MSPDAASKPDPTVQPVHRSVVEQVDAADSTLQNPKFAVLSLGGNLGNRLESLQGGVDALADTPGLRVKAVSPVYETQPWGVPADSQPAYFNAVVIVRTTLPPASLLERAQAIEEAFARVRGEQWGPRTLDIDLISYQGVRSENPRLTLPHPRAHERAFVLAPWHDVDPDAELPGHGRVAELLHGLPEQGVRRREGVTLVLPD